ncbi:hypothetical protein E4U55_003232 [Claviceps digitariae]|nr:hypothetical protein E4U55_003232 [Claviceps digitariae]
MPSLKTYLAAAGCAALAGADTIKITATGNNTFSPDTITANPGDVLEFHFQSGNHSVVAGDYECPCFPLPVGSGFSSGFFDVKSCEDEKVFRVTLANADTVVFYSSQGDECTKGMVGIVNPSEKQTLQNYKMRASQLTGCIMLPGKCCHGGQSADDKALCNDKDGKGDKNNTSLGGTDDKCSVGKNETGCGGKEDEGSATIAKSSVNMVQVPLLTVAVAAGAIVAFAGL